MKEPERQARLEFRLNADVGLEKPEPFARRREIRRWGAAAEPPPVIALGDPAKYLGNEQPARRDLAPAPFPGLVHQAAFALPVVDRRTFGDDGDAPGGEAFAVPMPVLKVVRSDREGRDEAVSGEDLAAKHGARHEGIAVDLGEGRDIARTVHPENKTGVSEGDEVRGKNQRGVGVLQQGLAHGRDQIGRHQIIGVRGDDELAVRGVNSIVSRQGDVAVVDGYEFKPTGEFFGAGVDRVDGP